MSAPPPLHHATTPRPPTDTRPWIRGSLVGSGLLLTLTVFVGSMQLLLARLGDELGARVALGAVAVTGLGFVAVQILLVFLLALEALKSNMEGASPPPGRSPL